MLRSSSIMLDDVLVIGEKQTPSIRVVNGNTIFFPKNSATLAGSSALEVLKKTPGVFVDGNDNVSIGGRNGVLIIFNGKPTYMQQEELVSMLKSMSSTSVTSIEVINNLHNMMLRDLEVLSTLILKNNRQKATLFL